MSKVKQREKNPNVHHTFHWIIQNSKLNRIQIAAKLGIARQTLYDREYQIVRVREHMIGELLEAAAVSADKIPLHIKQRDTDAELARFNKAERQKERVKANTPATNPQTTTARLQPGQDPLEAISAKGMTLEERIALRQPTDNPLILARRIKEDALIAARNLVLPPPTANRPHPVPPPATCKKGARMGEIDSLGDPRNIPFPPDYVHDPKNHRVPKQYVNLINFPDLVYEARQTMQPYEVRFVPRHSTPYHSSDNGLILRPAAWYTVNKTGKMGMGETQAEAMERAEQLRAEDDKLCADLM